MNGRAARRTGPADQAASGLPDPGWYAAQEIADLLAD
jgi:hypothetical protein